MANNAQITVSLVPQTVPDDRQCLKNADDVLAVVADFMTINGLPGQNGQSLPTQDIVGAQALALAQSNQNQLGVIQSGLLEYRSSNGWIQVTTPAVGGDGIYQVVFQEPMATDTYMVMLAFQGTNAHPAAYYGWNIVQGTMSAQGFTISFDNMPAFTSTKPAWLFAWKAEAFPNSTSVAVVVSNAAGVGGNMTGSVGDTISIFGSGFTNTKEVDFNGTSAAFTFVSDNVITAIVPAGATTGGITVTTTTSTGTSASAFTVV